METIMRIFIAGVLMGGGIWMFGLTYFTRRKVQILDEAGGTEMDAAIISKGFERFGNNRVYRTYYTYIVNGERFDADQIGNFSRIAPNDMLRIRYLPSNPAMHEIVGMNKALDLQSVVVILMGLGFIAAGIAFGLYANF